jgi:hypothetical protein
MLHEKYEADTNFWEITQKLAIEMEPELAAIDKLLDDDELYQIIKQGFSKHYPKTLVTGRH